MIHENEIIMSVIGLGVLIFIYLNRSYIKRIPSFKLLLAGYCTFTAGWALTVLEGFFYEELLNILEHISYAAGAIIFTVWCWENFIKARKEE